MERPEDKAQRGPRETPPDHATGRATSRDTSGRSDDRQIEHAAAPAPRDTTDRDGG